jgi:hypothetical protein
MIGSQLAMPILVMNLGGEMMYILNQRLQAQNIPHEKAVKVLGDVIRTMFTPQFIEELFKPQEMYTNAATKQIFDKLAHSSIMRLNKTSMDKLYDLMSMGVKYQLLSCTLPIQFLQVTINHLEGLEKMIDPGELTPLLKTAMSKCIQLYSQFTHADWLLLQQTLLQFFQGRKVKVSLFLQQNMQATNGVLIINNHGKLPFHTEKPGHIRYFENNTLIRTDVFHSELANHCIENRDIFDHSSRLGHDLYSKPIPGAPPVSPHLGLSSGLSPAYREAENAFHRNRGLHSSIAEMKAPTHIVTRGSKYTTEVSAKAELSLLAELLGANDAKHAGSKGGSDERAFKINLFPNQHFMNGAGAKEGAAGGDEEDTAAEAEGKESDYIVFEIDGTAGAKTLANYMEDLDLKEDFKRADAKGGDDDDLLALMDSAK